MTPPQASDAAAAAILRDDWLGQAMPLTGPQALTRTQQAAAIGAGIGRELELVEISPEAHRRDLRPRGSHACTRMMAAWAPHAQPQ